MPDEAQITAARRWRLFAFLALGVVALAALLLLPMRTRLGSGPPLHLKTFLKDGNGLETGAEVRIAGIRVGRVIGIHIRPDMSPASIEVEMEIEPSYSNSIPTDSKIRLGKAGLLGTTTIDNDIQFAKGVAVQNGAVLLAD